MRLLSWAVSGSKARTWVVTVIGSLTGLAGRSRLGGSALAQDPLGGGQTPFGFRGSSIWWKPGAAGSARLNEALLFNPPPASVFRTKSQYCFRGFIFLALISTSSWNSSEAIFPKETALIPGQAPSPAPFQADVSASSRI